MFLYMQKRARTFNHKVVSKRFVSFLFRGVFLSSFAVLFSFLLLYFLLPSIKPRHFSCLFGVNMWALSALFYGTIFITKAKWKRKLQMDFIIHSISFCFYLFLRFRFFSSKFFHLFYGSFRFLKTLNLGTRTELGNFANVSQSLRFILFFKKKGMKKWKQ